ncbi:MAG: hypothetical protein PHN44_10965 [Candidatus Marinimicrobia bacterium]|jgi:hypothetical protein|nr:hypothetical protein [Candidatus Neomarinimicrobiota bacterium]
MTDFMTIEGCDQKHKETMTVLTELNNRLYKDNGKKSIQSRLNEQEINIKAVAENQKKMDGALTRLFWTVATPLIMGALWACYAGVKFLITTGKL